MAKARRHRQLKKKKKNLRSTLNLKPHVTKSKNSSFKVPNNTNGYTPQLEHESEVTPASQRSKRTHMVKAPIQRSDFFFGKK